MRKIENFGRKEKINMREKNETRRAVYRRLIMRWRKRKSHDKRKKIYE